MAKKQVWEARYCRYHSDEITKMDCVPKGYRCPKCGHEEFFQMYGGLGDRPGEINLCRCKNCESSSAT